MKDLRTLKINKIELNDIKKFYNIKDYTDLNKLICSLIENNIIKPIKSSRTNGMKPALYNRYFIIYETKDYSSYINEINYELNPLINTAYYLKYPDRYVKDRYYIKKFSNFLDNDLSALNTTISKNERSFQIWQEEKFLSEGKGEKVLKNLGFDIKYLNIYETSEPLSYFSLKKDEPQNMLIIENKDTFYTFRKFLMDNNRNNILGQNISTVIYGSGKKIYKSFNDFKQWAEPYFFNKNNNIFYFGDLDYEGILIYEGLFETFHENVEIKLFKEAYIFMINKCVSNNLALPKTKEMQNKNIKEIFLNNFHENYSKKISNILTSGKYIPQEIININDLEKFNG